MKTRILSGLIMIPLVLVLIFRGLPLAIVAFLISGVAVWELFKGFSNLGYRGNIFIAWGALIALYLIYLLRLNDTYLMGWLFLSVVASIIGIFNLEKHKAADAIVTIFGIIYIEFLVYHIVMLANTDQGIMVWMIGITAIFTDVAAYFTGYFLGKHKLCPKLSPKKTIEGSIGGMLGSVLASVVFALIAKIDIFPHIIVMGILGSVFAQIGDLSASALKRKMDIKDYGDVIPGHGGIMDRIDSIIFTAPFIYYYVMLIMAK